MAQKRNSRLAFLKSDIVESVMAKMRVSKRRKDLRVMTFQELYAQLEKPEIRAIKTFLGIDPRKYGFRGKFLGIDAVPRDLVKITNKAHIRSDQKVRMTVYLPRRIYEHFKKMNREMDRDIGRTLIIESGYRSPAYQIIVFFYNLRANGFNALSVMRKVALPGYSEHGAPKRQAIDVAISGNGGGDFSKTKEFAWLLKNADRFGFYLSYPKNNKEGIMYEPWHWHFES
jgi:LAS superfamily LD-carboxypeptidase LdcB